MSTIDRLKINDFIHAQSVELCRDHFVITYDNETGIVSYNPPHTKIIEMLTKLSEGIKELIIFERPSFDYILRQIGSSPKNLRKVIILDNISQRDLSWILCHAPNAKLIFPVPYLERLNESTNVYVIHIEQIAFKSLLIPFKDIDVFRSKTVLQIHDGSFKNGHLNPANIYKFINFLNEFTNLNSIDAFFTLQTQPSASPFYRNVYEGFAFYETIKKMEPSMFKYLSFKLSGRIRFVARINNFQDMCIMMNDDLNQSVEKGIVEYDENTPVIQRIHSGGGLQIEFSITPA